MVLKVKIIAKTPNGKLALEKALFVTNHPQETLKLCRNWAERLQVKNTLKLYELKLLSEEPYEVSYLVKTPSAQYALNDPNFWIKLEQMMKDYGAEKEDYDTEIMD